MLLAPLSQLFPEKNEILIATLEYPPFIYAEGDQVKGPIVDKIRNAFIKLNINPKIVIFPISRRLAMVKAGEADAYFSLKKTIERESDYLFTNVPLLQQPFVFFARSNSGINWDGKIENITKYKIGVVTKTSYGKVFDDYVKNRIITNIEETQTFELNIKKLIAGRIDLVINSYDVGMYIITNLHAENEITALSPAIEIVNSYLAFTKTKDYSKLAHDFDLLLSANK